MCYDHLAGHIGVALARGLEREHVVKRVDGSYTFGRKAPDRLDRFGIDVTELQSQRRPVVRECLDWSERELHIAGALGAALATRLFELGWIKRRPGTRSVEITAEGSAGLATELGVELPARES
jgi:hypothetical protein